MQPQGYMKRIVASLIAALAVFTLAQCSSDTPRQSPTEPGHGALTITIDPNPIVATRVTGNTYDFPFDVRVSNPGSLPVTIERIQIDVTALGGLKIYSDTKTAADIQGYGYPTLVPPGETLSYRFTPRQDVSDDRLFSGVSALLTAVGTDSAGKRITANVRVSVTR